MIPFFEWREAPPGDFAVIGDPVGHSRSPRMQKAAFEFRGESYSYNAIHVPPGEVAAALERFRTLGYRGINVTVPHKAEARLAMSSVDEFAARIDAVNTVRLADMHGINTDGPGFLDTIARVVTPGDNVLLLGAGGSARAIALALALEGYNLHIYNRTQERAVALVRELAIDAEVLESPTLDDASLIVNATSVSLNGDSLPMSFESASRGAVAYDLVYGDTPFLKSAHDAGLVTMDGKGLLVAQGARSLEFWLGGTAPRDVMLEAIR